MPEIVDKKAWYTSKTLWVNFVAVVGAVAVGQFGVSTEQWGGIATMILAVANIGLRFITNSPVGLTEE